MTFGSVLLNIFREGERVCPMKLKSYRNCWLLSFFAGLSLTSALSTAAFAAPGVKVSFCNENEQKLFLAVAYEAQSGDPLVSRGWWVIDPNKCSDVELPIIGNKLLVYANSENQLMEWRGQTQLCVDRTNKFDFNNASEIACQGEGLAMRSFKELSMRQLTESANGGVPKYAFTPDSATRLGDAVRLCNDSEETIYLSYSQKSSQALALVVAGWFKVMPGKCHETVKAADSDELYLFASNEQGDKRWKGDIPLCTNSYDGYLFTEPASMTCHGNNERRQLFKKIPMNMTGDFEYHLKSIGSETARSMVELCNKGAENIVFVIASANPDFQGEYVSIGWFGVKPGECSKALAIDSDTLHIFVQNIDGEVLRSGSFPACIHSSKAFEFGDATAMSCDGEGEEKRSFDAIKIEPGNVKVQLP